MNNRLSSIVLYLRGVRMGLCNESNRYRPGGQRLLLLLLFLGLLAAPVFARDWRDIRSAADRDLPPRMQYYNKLKGKTKLLPWGQESKTTRRVLTDSGDSLDYLRRI